MKTVKIVNIRQAGLYIKNGLDPLKVYWGNNALIFEFDREASQPLFTKWRSHELV